jgi:Fe-S-cluster-containing dehydrogenase component
VANHHRNFSSQNRRTGSSHCYGKRLRAPSPMPPERLDESLHRHSQPLDMPADAISRRRFLTLLSASAALALENSGCSSIDRGAVVPYTKKPEDVIPGIPTYYASTFQEGIATHGVLVKTREGRPIHIEEIPEHAASWGRPSLRAVADLLTLYDPDRLRRPSCDGIPSTWEKAQEEIGAVLNAARDAAKPVLILTEAVVSPTRKALIRDLKKALPALCHAAWEPLSPQSAFLSSQSLFGETITPRIRIDRADVILSLQADFMGVDENAPALIRDFAARRRISKPTDSMSRLWVLEGCMSLTGSNADQRLPARPSQIARLVFSLAHFLAESGGMNLPTGLSVGELKSFDLNAMAKDLLIEPSRLEALGEDLKRAGRSALVLAGPALPAEAHVGCQLLNSMLGAEGWTIDTAAALPAPELLTLRNLDSLFKEAAQGKFAAAIFWGANPAYAFPRRSTWKEAVAKIPMTVRIGLYEDETALDCRWRLPEHHWLEAWGDFESAAALIRLRQPAMPAMHDTRQGEDILLSFLRAFDAGVPPSWSEYLKSRWQREIYPAGSPAPFEDFWNASLHDGALKRDFEPHRRPALNADAVRMAVAAAASSKGGASAGDLELLLLPGAGTYDGRYANNGWLNELPDPVTKATWGNPLLLSPRDASRFGFKDGDLVKVSSGMGSVEVPVLVQQGQTAGVAGLALGYGRRTGNVAVGVGANAYPIMDPGSDSPQLIRAVKLTRLDGQRAIPRTQEHDSMEGRDLARSWTLQEYLRKTERREAEKKERGLDSLIPERRYAGHKWGMAIDLSACVGCSGCVIACQSENNIPVVGPERVAMGRHMHWIRIDRYYEGDPVNPSVFHQPILCQHCDNAPCEIVCPVNATTHSPDGLNQMAYNRCVGTRYCSNNCPFKVRRFNFFDYTSTKKEPENLVFNPEVSVRPRGVMEKCTFCIQRIQDARQKANVEERAVKDGEIEPACSAACPAQAIVFGDLNDPESKIARVSKTDRGYRMLEELGIEPSITYLTDISNPIAGKRET